jgi:sugar phosphate isomerase/epimerase
MDDDLERSYDQFALTTEMAAERGISTTIEFAMSLTVTDLQSALEVIGYVGRPELSLLVDTMHVVRSGNAGDLAGLDPALIGCVQLSDHSLVSAEKCFAMTPPIALSPGKGKCRSGTSWQFCHLACS